MGKSAQITKKLLLVMVLTILGTIFFYKSCNDSKNVKAIEQMQFKLDTLYKVSQEKKERLIDTLIIEKTNETKTVEKLKQINNYYENNETFIDTIPIIISNVKSPFANEKLTEWKLREDTGYYDIPK
jgi:uncharacterized protein YbaP (TraB family)